MHFCVKEHNEDTFVYLSKNYNLINSVNLITFFTPFFNIKPLNISFIKLYISFFFREHHNSHFYTNHGRKSFVCHGT